MKNKYIILIFACAFILLISGCANPVELAESVIDKPAGFWEGIWHGIVCPFAFIGSLFNDDIAIYAANNKGGLYDCGFIIGIGGFGATCSCS